MLKFQLSSESVSYFNINGHVVDGDILTYQFSIAPSSMARQVKGASRNGTNVGVSNALGISKMPQVKVLPLNDDVRDTINFNQMNQAESTLVKLGFGDNFTFEHHKSYREQTRTTRVGNAEYKLNRMLDTMLPRTMGMQFRLREAGDKPELLTISLERSSALWEPC